MKKKKKATVYLSFFFSPDFSFVSLPFYFKYSFPVGMKSHNDSSSSFVTHADAADRQSHKQLFLPLFFFLCVQLRGSFVFVFFIGSLNDLFNVSLSTFASSSSFFSTISNAFLSISLHRRNLCNPPSFGGWWWSCCTTENQTAYSTKRVQHPKRSRLIFSLGTGEKNKN